MTTVFDLKRERSVKGFMTSLLAVSTATLLVIALAGNTSADAGLGHSGPLQVSSTSNNQGADTVKLVLFMLFSRSS